jgi:hypothetical protein
MVVVPTQKRHYPEGRYKTDSKQNQQNEYGRYHVHLKPPAPAPVGGLGAKLQLGMELA